MRPLLRLAWRDATRHRLRTILMVAVIAIPFAACVLVLSMLTSTTTTRQIALDELPPNTQASIIASTLPPPVPQLPEAFPDGVRNPALTPATPEQIRATLPAGTVLHEWWESPGLIATTALDLTPGKEQVATAANIVGNLDPTALTTMTMREADASTLPMLLPTLARGNLPQRPDEVVISSGAARNADLDIGDAVQFIAPPDTGMRGVNGRVAAVVQNSLRAYRVVGVVDNSPETPGHVVGYGNGGAGRAGENLAWALPNWITPHDSDSTNRRGPPLHSNRTTTRDVAECAYAQYFRCGGHFCRCPHPLSRSKRTLPQEY